MLGSIKDISEEINTLLEFNRNFLSKVQLHELYDMKGKLDLILSIKKCMWDIDNIHLSRDFESDQGSEKKHLSEASTVASTIASTVDSTKQPTPRSFACSSGYYEPAIDATSPVVVVPASKEATIVTRDNTVRVEIDLDKERKHMQEANGSFVEHDIKVANEAQSMPHSDSTPSMQELLFSKALMRSMKRDGDREGPSPNTLAYAAIATGTMVDLSGEACSDCGHPETPKTEYRTIALSSSSPKG